MELLGNVSLFSSKLSRAEHTVAVPYNSYSVTRGKLEQLYTQAPKNPGIAVEGIGQFP